jgi:hypothetical protein
MSNTIESFELYPEVIVYKNMIPNPEKLMDIFKRSENEEVEPNSLFQDWEGWFHFGTQMSFPWFPDLSMDQLKENMPPLILDDIKDGEREDEYVAKLISSVFYHASLDYIKRNNISFPNWQKMGIALCKYNRDGKDYAMAYHTDFDTAQPEKPGFKFGITFCLYLNDDYVGGEPVFWHKKLEEATEYKPYAGDIVIFPSDEPVYHGVRKIESGDKYFIRLFWGWDYPGSEKWWKNANKYGEEEWRKKETARLKKEIWEGQHHFDVVWDKDDLKLPKYKSSEESPCITPIFSSKPLVKKGKGNE